MRRPLYLAALSFVLGAASNVFGQGPTFTQIDFPNATSTQSWGINSRGDIVGYYVNADKTSHGFLLSGGHFTTIDYPGAAVTLVNGINSRGDIVGEYGVTLTSSHLGFLLSSNGIFTPIAYPGATYTSGIGITPAGDIVGIYNFADNVSHGFLLSGDKYTSFDFPGSSSTTPNGIDAQGDIVGGYNIGSVTHGFLLSNGNFKSFDFPNAALTTATGANTAGDIVGRYRDAAAVNHGFLMSGPLFISIDYPNATFTGATAIDPSGNVVGRCTVGGVTHGYLMTREPAPPTHYTLTDLGPVGGPPGQPFYLTNNKLVSGAASAPDNTMHGFLWRKGLMTDLGTPGLGGSNSVAFANNEKGVAVGQAETSNLDPNGEDFCGFKSLGLPTSGSTCVPFTWQYGVMTPLRTLGGNNGAANQINSRGQIAGLAENSTADPACPSPQVFQFKPVIWENGQIQELPTAAGDLEGVAYAINESGQVAGGSGQCAAFNPNSLVSLQPLHALLWQTGTMTDLGSLGGTGHANGILAVNLNNNGQVVGNSDLPGDQTFHAFLWSKVTGIVDLGTLPGDVASAATAISDAGIVIGGSLDADFNPRAFVRQNGVMTDLNTLIPAGSALYLLVACSINAHGEIIGVAATSEGEVHGFMATPSNSTGTAEPMLLTEKARKQVRQSLHFRRF